VEWTGQLYTPAAPDRLPSLSWRAADEPSDDFLPVKHRRNLKWLLKRGDFLQTVTVILKTLARLVAKYLPYFRNNWSGSCFCCCRCCPPCFANSLPALETHWSESERDGVRRRSSPGAGPSAEVCVCGGGEVPAAHTPPTLSTLRACGVSLVDVVGAGVGAVESERKKQLDEWMEAESTTGQHPEEGKGARVETTSVDKGVRRTVRVKKSTRECVGVCVSPSICAPPCVRLCVRVVVVSPES